MAVCWTGAPDLTDDGILARNEMKIGPKFYQGYEIHI